MFTYSIIHYSCLLDETIHYLCLLTLLSSICVYLQYYPLFVFTYSTIHYLCLLTVLSTICVYLQCHPQFVFAHSTVHCLRLPQHYPFLCLHTALSSCYFVLVCTFIHGILVFTCKIFHYLCCPIFGFACSSLFVFTCSIACGFAGALFVYTHRKFVTFIRGQKRLKAFLQKKQVLSFLSLSLSHLVCHKQLFHSPSRRVHRTVKQLFARTLKNNIFKLLIFINIFTLIMTCRRILSLLCLLFMSVCLCDTLILERLIIK